MKSLRYFGLIAAGTGGILLPGSATAQRQPPSPDQRLERLERQMDQLQRQVFPRGRPADTAGFSAEPAATQSSVATLDQRLDALERQMADMLRQSEENGHRLQTLQADLANARAAQDQRIGALEQRASEPAPGPTVAVPAEPIGRPSVSTAIPTAPRPTSGEPVASTTAAGDPGEDAYTQGFKAWEAGNYNEAVASLGAFVKAYPKHRRVSYANNLIGRSLLDQGQAREAAAALLANYRNNPAGERAPDSLLYLGQALMKLGQPGQACKAYGELDAVYGAKIRPDLKKLEADAKTQAQCS